MKIFHIAIFSIFTVYFSYVSFLTWLSQQPIDQTLIDYRKERDEKFKKRREQLNNVSGFSFKNL